MRYFMTIILDPQTDAGAFKVPEALGEAMGPYIEKEVASGRLISTGGLKRSSEATRVSGRTGRLATTDGPFAEAKEVVGGYVVIEVPDKAAAVAAASDFVELTLPTACPTSSSRSARSTAASTTEEHDMEFMVIRKADAETEAGAKPSAKLIDDMTSYNERLVRSGKMKAGAGLHPSSRGARVIFTDGRPTVVDGPFAEAKEMIAGYSIIEAGSLQEVIDLVRDWPREDGNGNVAIEIRQIVTAADLGFTQEQQDRYDTLVARQAQQQQ
jgi:hypothetical protein